MTTATANYAHMTDEQLEAHLGMLAQSITTAIDDGDRETAHRLGRAHAAAFHEFRCNR